ncbi:MAG: hypothetical protein Q4B60_00470 [Erysipelotrichaceae bacterium]|nr:hypothetical protein [Erysipelotrichaceae bacterium]
MKLFKSRRKRVKRLLLVILPFFLMMLIFAFCAYRTISGKVSDATGTNNSPTSSKNVIDSMGYKLRDNATDLQKEYFAELKKAVEDGTDKGEIARQVAKNYVADFYTWSNKRGSYDVGGLCYVHAESTGNVYARAKDGYYKYVTYYINELGAKNLLEVSSVEVSGGDKTGTFELNGKVYDSYFITCDWTYDNEDNLAPVTRNFVKREYFNVIEREDGRFEIVEAYGDN